MKTNEYHFITHWRVEANIADVYRLISHPEDFPRWWPQVYLKVEPLSPGDAHGLGRRVRLPSPLQVTLMAAAYGLWSRMAPS
jgi:hypothetical protein